jgi:hypothetical protein
MPKQSKKATQNIAIQAALKILKNPSINEKTPTVNGTANRFGLSEATLRRAINNGGPLNCSGPAKYLTDHEEQQLVGYCMNMQRLGFGLTKSGVNYCVLEIFRQNKRFHPFNKSGPSRSWWTRFMKEYSNLSFRVPQALTEAGA